mmetsp:Transcript_18817/g.30049  ORF Transcript_18817/g.30049 Transcript_18817/m.30049 type:complete len:202 (+) Transcript_18817:1234-1839(+)
MNLFDVRDAGDADKVVGHGGLLGWLLALHGLGRNRLHARWLPKILGSKILFCRILGESTPGDTSLLREDLVSQELRALGKRFIADVWAGLALSLLIQEAKIDCRGPCRLLSNVDQISPKGVLKGYLWVAKLPKQPVIHRLQSLLLYHLQLPQLLLLLQLDLVLFPLICQGTLLFVPGGLRRLLLSIGLEPLSKEIYAVLGL